MKLPKEWKVESLENLSEGGITNGTFFDPKKVGTGYRHINIDQMYIGPQIVTDNLKLLKVDATTFTKKQAKYGDVFFTRSSLVLDGIAYCNVLLDKSDDFTFDDHLMRVRPKREVVLPQYLNEYCRSPFARKFFLSRAKRSTMTTIGQADIGPLQVALPTMAEQEKIAEILTTWDHAIENLTNQLREQRRQFLGLRAALFHRDMDLPKVRLGDFLKLNYGKSPKGIFSENGKYPVMGTGGVTGRTDTPLCASRGIVIGRKGTIDKPCLVEGPFWAIDTTYYITESTDYSLSWVFHLLGFLKLKQYNEASGVPSLNRETLYDLDAHLPSQHQQSEVARLLDVLLSQNRNLKLLIDVTMRQKHGLMQKLLTGKVRVKV